MTSQFLWRYLEPLSPGATRESGTRRHPAARRPRRLPRRRLTLRQITTGTPQPGRRRPRSDAPGRCPGWQQGRPPATGSHGPCECGRQRSQCGGSPHPGRRQSILWRNFGECSRTAEVNNDRFWVSVPGSLLLPLLSDLSVRGRRTLQTCCYAHQGPGLALWFLGRSCKRARGGRACLVRGVSQADARSAPGESAPGALLGVGLIRRGTHPGRSSHR
ncbi:hypothetical protein FBY36_3599 [Arthrobacter sp. SLBN-122]|nr:hypothetical protein FBY36_3599 [Arthrobacter sp. SLBN-122]